MPAHLLAALSAAGVLERSGPRHHRFLRVAPRFLAHAEAAASHAALAPSPRASLERALATWDGYVADVRSGAAFLADFLGERDQLGSLHPVFPVLESFARAAA